MRLRSIVTATATAVALVALPGTANAADLTDQINALDVAAEHTSGYDRDKFGDYDRDALLAKNFEAWPDCDGYYSRYDGQCYEVGGGTTKEEADDNVDVDHTVALQEAWQSGAYQWGSSKLDQYAGDVANLSIMTDNVNQSKGGDDVTGWVPSNDVCHFVSVVVSVKSSYGLGVDQAEKEKLLSLAETCGSGSGGTGGDNSGSGDKPPQAPAPDPAKGNLPVTG